MRNESDKTHIAFVNVLSIVCLIIEVEKSSWMELACLDSLCGYAKFSLSEMSSDVMN